MASKKKTETYAETYKKGVHYINKEDFLFLAQHSDVVIEINRAGKFSDGSEFQTVTLQCSKTALDDLEKQKTKKSVLDMGLPNRFR